MFQLPRPWSKKRGARQLGRPTWGAAGEALFFAGLFLLGVLAMAWPLARQVIASDRTAMQPGFGFWTLLIAAASLIILGGAGLIYRIVRVGVSHERISALTQAAESIEIRAPESAAQMNYPTVPRAIRHTESPGTHLAFRLPSVGSPAYELAAVAALTLTWNAGVLILAAIAIERWRAGRPDYASTLALIPFVLIGLWLDRHFFRLLRRSAGLGATIVEVSDHPLSPGERALIYVAQFGRLRLRRLSVQLVCEEEATYRQGTDLRVQRHVAFEQELMLHRNVRIDRDRPWEQQCMFVIPEHAMHSFQSSSNALRWKIVIIGEAPRWPSYCRSFPVVVRPLDSLRSASR